MGLKEKKLKRQSLASEERACGKYGQVTPRSGADARRPGDVEFPHLLVEDKVRSSDKFYLTPALWAKIQKEARVRGRIPAYRVTLKDYSPIAILCDSDMAEIAQSVGIREPIRRMITFRGKSVVVSDNLFEIMEEESGQPLGTVGYTHGAAWSIQYWKDFEAINNKYIEENNYAPD